VGGLSATAAAARLDATSMTAEINEPRKLGLRMTTDGGMPGEPRRSRQIGDHAATVAVVVAIVLLMQVGSYFAPPYILPSPISILGSLLESFTTEYLQILITLLRLLVSLALSITIGTALGIIMGTFASVRPFLRALVIIDTGIPALSWMLVAVFWFKDPELRMLFIMVVIVVPIYALNVHDGIRAMPKEWLEMCESFRPTRLQVLRYLILPHIVPYVLMTTKSTVGYATRMLIFAELIGSSLGIGARMGLAQATFHMDSVIAWTVLLVIMNMLAQGCVGLLERYLLRWRDEASVR
jgi:NitT/TauT family transport system permease protein